MGAGGGPPWVPTVVPSSTCSSLAPTSQRSPKSWRIPRNIEDRRVSVLPKTRVSPARGRFPHPLSLCTLKIDPQSCTTPLSDSIFLEPLRLFVTLHPPHKEGLVPQWQPRSWGPPVVGRPGFSQKLPGYAIAQGWQELRGLHSCKSWELGGPQAE